ncbi:hypothetical protein [Actinocrispum sp. NPDC049592]|uniref:hypothetical protein n=1 Tax=Actinocrispum sp. NPDC049592 TaxID=3154835 RepID=UPI0034342754
MSAYAAQLDLLHRQAGGTTPVASASGVVLGSLNVVPDSPDHPLARFGLGVGHAVPSTPDAREEFATGLLGLHRSLLRQGIAHAMRHLANRSSTGAPLLDRQLVQAALADVALEIRETAALPVADPAARWRAHQALVAAGRLLLSLLGASSFLVSGPGGDLHLAEVTGNVYLREEAA